MLNLFTTNIYSQILYMLSMILYGLYKNVNIDIDIIHNLPFAGCLFLFTIGIYFEFKIRHDYSPLTKKLFGNKPLFKKPVYILIRITSILLFLGLCFIPMRMSTYIGFNCIFMILHCLALLNDRIKKNKIYETLEMAEKETK